MLVDTDRSVATELAMIGASMAAEELVIPVPGIMRGKQRPRFSRRSGRTYTPDQTVNLEAHVKQCAIQAVGHPCLSGPLYMSIDVGVTIPKSWSKRKQTEAANGTLRPTGKPDLDNIIKLVADALNGIVWGDDAQIVAQVATKHYAVFPETVIRVRAV